MAGSEWVRIFNSVLNVQKFSMQKKKGTKTALKKFLAKGIQIGVKRMALTKPASVENDAFMSAKWDEVTDGREFRACDASSIALLCQWYKIASQAQDELADFNNQTAYPSENGDLKPLPQIGTLKTASMEIRALNKQLGIQSEGEVRTPKEEKVTKLEIVTRKRQARRAKAS